MLGSFNDFSAFIVFIEQYKNKIIIMDFYNFAHKITDSLNNKPVIYTSIENEKLFDYCYSSREFKTLSDISDEFRDVWEVVIVKDTGVSFCRIVECDEETAYNLYDLPLNVINIDFISYNDKFKLITTLSSIDDFDYSIEIQIDKIKLDAIAKIIVSILNYIDDVCSKSKFIYNDFERYIISNFDAKVRD